MINSCFENNGMFMWRSAFCQNISDAVAPNQDTHMFATYTESVESPYSMYCIFTVLCYAFFVTRTGLSLLSTTICHVVLHFVKTINKQWSIFFNCIYILKL